MSEKRKHGTPASKFLAPGARFGDGHGYLNAPQRELPLVADEPEVVARIAEARAMCDEPEAPSRAVIDAQADLARTYDRLRQEAMVQQARQARQFLTLENRIRDVQRRAKAQHVDVSRDLYVLRKMLDRSEKAGHKQTPPAVVRRLENVEARLDGLPDAA